IKPTGKSLTFTVALSIWVLFSTLAIVLRICARHMIGRIGSDDYLMVAAWVVYIFVAVCDYLSINYGLGAHAFRLTENDINEGKKWFFFSGVGYAITTALIKTSICVLLLRLLGGTRRVLAWIIYGVIALAWAGTFIRVVAYMARCKPLDAAWDPLGECRSATILSNVTWFFSAVCIATDWICAIIPIFIILRLNLPRRAKIQLAFILALGMIASVATIIRMKHLVDYTRTDDALYRLDDVSLWSETEACLGIIAGSLPTMKPLLR
ncbi:hypothetical protein DM02DRAFT_499811, partial [Periconia macrospinosa]